MDTLMRSPIVITTYHTCAVKRTLKNADDAGCLLHKIKWNRVVFDEAHHLRNKNNIYFGSFKLNAEIRWMVSGTPIQNKMKDFYNLCELLGMPSSYYADETSFEHLYRNFVLKRTKMDVGLALPQLIINNYDIEWADLDERILSQKIHQALAFADSKTRLQLYLFARQCCILPSLLKGKTIAQDAFGVGVDFATSKLDAVISIILSRKDNGCGKLIFCHFREEIDLVVDRLKKGGMNNVCAFDGRSSTGSRNKMLSGNYDAIVLQVQTGCEGLNLQKGFSEVYFVSPHWNPAVEDQAVARCHRFGQLNDVHVFRFCMDKIDVVDNIPQVAIDDLDVDVDLSIPLAIAVAVPFEEKQTITTLDKYIYMVQERKRETYF
jgi:SNF2 family DNA or RNA helicase